MKGLLTALYKRGVKKVDSERIARMLDKTFSWSVARTFSREEAEELTQEIMFQAIRSVGELRDYKKFEPWFWRLADITLKVFKRGKAKSRNMISFDEVADLAFEDDYDFEDDDKYQNLRRNIVRMSAIYRDIIVMHYYDNLSCKTIAQKLGLPEGTVMYRLSLARNKLKERCSQMNETALKPAQLDIRITGEGNYNGESKPFPWQYIEDALSQNILWRAYREPKTIEELSETIGVPAFFIEDRIKNLIRREAVIQPAKNTVQTDFLIFDDAINSYAPTHACDAVAAVSEQFYQLSRRLTEKVLSSGVQTAGRSFDEMLCLLSVMLLDKFVPDYKPAEYTQTRQKYDGGRWDYIGFMQKSSFSNIGIGMEKSMNNYESGKLAHYSYHYAPFEYRKMMFDHEIDVCHAVLQKTELTEKQKEYAAKLIAEGYFAKNESGEVVCAVPLFAKEQHDLFVASVKNDFADFLPLYSEQIKKYLNGYMKLFPKHLKEAAARNGFHVFVAMFNAIAADWAKSGKINIPNGAICDTLIMM
jgi:RNA polymerase sigma factor (sigma-70 family)